jgi:hypothetical protein
MITKRVEAESFLLSLSYLLQSLDEAFPLFLVLQLACMRVHGGKKSKFIIE